MKAAVIGGVEIAIGVIVAQGDVLSIGAEDHICHVDLDGLIVVLEQHLIGRVIEGESIVAQIEIDAPVADVDHICLSDRIDAGERYHIVIAVVVINGVATLTGYVIDNIGTVAGENLIVTVGAVNDSVA